MTFDKKSIFSLICGALFVCLGLYYSIKRVGIIVENAKFYDEFSPYGFCLVVYTVLGILLGLAVIMRQKIPLLAGLLVARFAVAVASVVLAATEEACAPSFSFHIFIVRAHYSLALGVGDIAFAISLWMIYKSKIKKQASCFISLVTNIVMLVSIIYSLTFEPFTYLLPYLFLTLWMTTLILPETEDAPISESLFGDADRIEEYKRLLDDGVITEEEYERIKRQILSLK